MFAELNLNKNETSRMRIYSTFLHKLGKLDNQIKGIDTPKTVASFLHTIFEVLPFTTLASSVNGKTSKKSVPKRRDCVWCV